MRQQLSEKETGEIYKTHRIEVGTSLQILEDISIIFGSYRIHLIYIKVIPVFANYALKLKKREIISLHV